MYKTFQVFFRCTLALLLGSGLLFACSGTTDECQNTGDCKKSKGDDYVCSLSAAGRVCKKKTTQSACDPECTGSQKCVNGQCVTCENDTECSADETCVSGTCKKKDTGGCSPLCASGEVCSNGKCVQCAQDTDCKTGEKCNNNKCEPPVGNCNPPCTGTDKCFQNQCVQCTADTDCPTGNACVSNQCQKKPECSPACAIGEQCVNSKCVQCTKNEDCSATEICNTDGKCEAKPTGCNPPCQATEKCENNKCVPKGCTQDSDCQSDETCDTSSGQCNKKQTGCNPACQSNEKCVNNQCVQCENNGDCASSEKCDAGKCVPNTIQCNPACASGEKCVSGQCVQCATNSDCASGETCVSGKCTKQTGCSSDADCTTGSKCVAGVCQTPAGSSCTAPATCPTGYTCLNADSKSICFQDCSADATACATNTTDGRTSCLTVGTNTSTNQPIRVCMKIAKKGDSCGGATWATNGQALCDSNTTPPLYCNKATKCAEVVYRKKAGETCNKTTDTNEPRYACDPTLNLVCLESTGKCASATVAKEGEPCDLQGTTLGTPTVCDPKVTDMICVRFDQSGALSRCQRRCDPLKAGQCSHNSNLTCWKVFNDGGGMCFDLTCTTDTDCIHKGYKCQADPLGGSGKVCWPQPPTGPKAYAEACGNPITTSGCKAGVTCLLTNDETGYCTNDCSSTTCAAGKDAAGKSVAGYCETFGSGTTTFKRCAFKCGATGQTCPKDIPHCQDVTNSAGTSVKICTVVPPVGPNAFGAICSSPTSTKGCQKDLFCLQTTNAANGYCSRDCTTDNKCPTFKDTAGKSFTPACTAGLTSGTNKICIVGCGQPGQTCPAGTTCTPLGSSGSFCLAP